MSDKLTPKLSVVMPVWNGEKYLYEAIQSILNQTESDFEFLLVDDGSTDRSVEIAENFNDPRIRILSLDHGGIVVALNHGVRAARSNWIARMDADDIAMPDRFEKQLMALLERPEAVMCYTNYNLLMDNGETVKSRSFPKTHQDLLFQLCWRTPIAHDSVIFRRDIFEECKGYLPDERHAEDFGLWGRIAEKGLTIGIPQPLLTVRKHGESISVVERDKQNDAFKKLSILHCKKFMMLCDEDALRMSRILRGEIRNHVLANWVWLFGHCFHRFNTLSPSTIVALVRVAKSCLFSRVNRK